ncbi:MAG: hydantoinase/oxoprolinase family protein [Euryarchaeota archaeon]|nr:hydantoinase/oxoprolinase family protein [Euryarchaeota archaeon]
MLIIGGFAHYKVIEKEAMILGIDVGGANTKVATSDGSFVRLIYAPLWRNRATIYDVLSGVKRRLEAEGKGIEAVGVVMTGELCGCFNTKREGVLYIKNAVTDMFENAKFFDSYCTFKNNSYVDKDPLSFAATNWLASAKFISREYKNVIFVDIGSTTTDVIPIVEGKVKAKRTDFERLNSGELIYSGVLRTGVPHLLKRVKVRGEEYGTSSELFAISADAYLVLGDITNDDHSCESPNGYSFSEKDEGKSIDKAMRRLARMVCSDLEEIGKEGAVSIAEQVKEAQVEGLIDSMKRIKKKYGLKKVVSAGIGDFIVKEAADSLNIEFLSLSFFYGKKVSAVFPAYAVAKLFQNRFDETKEDS